MNLVNLQRDMLHVDLDKTPLGFGGSVLVGTTVSMKADGTVLEGHGGQLGFDTVTNVAGNWSAVGLFMEPPTVNATPYRIKGYANIVNDAWCVIGIAPPTPVTGNNTLTNVSSFPIHGGIFDEVVLLDIPTAKEAIGFGIAVGEAATVPVQAYISVQKLSVAPPDSAGGLS